MARYYDKEVIEKVTRNLLLALGEDPSREGLNDTPSRVARAWFELTEGYGQHPEVILSTEFEEGACKSMVVLKDCYGWSTCEHHLLPFSYTAHVGYIPNGRVVGISKLARLVECFGRRLQIQERFTQQVADAVMDHLKPFGVMVVIEGQHLCMKARGVRQQNSVMITSEVRGVFEDVATRAEFMSLIRS